MPPFPAPPLFATFAIFAKFGEFGKFGKFGKFATFARAPEHRQPHSSRQGRVSGAGCPLVVAW